MAQAVKQSGSELGITEDLHPFTEGQVGRDHGRAPLVTFGEQIKEQFTAGAVKRDKSQFVYDQQVISLQSPVQPSQQPFITGFQQRTHQLRRPGKAHPETPAGSLHAQCDGNVRFALM